MCNTTLSHSVIQLGHFWPLTEVSPQILRIYVPLSVKWQLVTRKRSSYFIFVCTIYNRICSSSMSLTLFIYPFHNEDFIFRIQFFQHLLNGISASLNLFSSSSARSLTLHLNSSCKCMACRGSASIYLFSSKQLFCCLSVISSCWEFFQGIFIPIFIPHFRISSVPY